MSGITELHKKLIISKLENDIREYFVHMNEHMDEPMFPEKQIHDAICGCIQNADCINDFSVTCKEGNIPKDTILNVTLDIRLKPETIIQDFK